MSGERDDWDALDFVAVYCAVFRKTMEAMR